MRNGPQAEPRPKGAVAKQAMPRQTVIVLPVVAALVATIAGALRANPQTQSKGVPSYNFDVRPILAENCFGCHGPDLKANKADLRLDTFEGATAKLHGSDGYAIVPGKPDESELLRRVHSTDPSEVMPEAESGKKLTDEQKAVLERWIEAGAPYEKHWSFIPPRKVEAKDTSGWSRNGIDPFIRRELDAAGLKPAPEADKAALLRRVTLALTGLPPTAEELDAHLADQDPKAYEKVVDRLLASDASAEHFTRLWLDAARYADSHGIHIDNYRAIWPYRDWVLAAFKANLRWDTFTTEQIAGDLLPDPTIDQRVATGFNRCLATTGEGGAIPEEYLAIYAKDRVDTTATIWLGMTLGCASCHDHKFDPVSTKEFYQFTAFFRNTSMSALDGNNAEHPPVVRIVTPENRARLAAIEPELATAQKNLASVMRESGSKAKAWALQKDKVAIQALLTIRATNSDALTATAAGKINLIGKGLPLVANGIAGASTPVANERIQALAFSDLPKFEGKGYSWGAWIYCTGKGRGALFSRMDAGRGYRGFDLWVENGAVGAHAIENWPDKATRRLTKKALSVGWHHVMAVWDAKLPANQRLKIYVDGALADTDSHETGGETIAIDAPVHIGTRVNGPKGLDATVSHANGILLQDARIYSQALTPNEVTAAAISTLTSTPPPSTNIKERDAALVRMYAETADPIAQAATKTIDNLNQEKTRLTMGSVVSLVMDDVKGQQASAYILNRGQYTDKGEKVSPGTPAALHPFPKDAPNNRLGLARWLTSKDNPLVGRVTMNRLWYQLMGTGIVETTEDLGITGARPSHPELLDWLAVEFAESGWDHRAMVRLIVTSATFRQAATVTAEKRERDPRPRLDAEVLRDQALAASGLLVHKVGGPSVKPYQPEGIWEEVAMKESNTRFYKQDKGEAVWRRSLYSFWKRTAVLPTLEILNAPSREVCVVRRDRTNTPLQALVLLNDPTYVEASRALADVALAASPTTDGRLDILSRRLLARSLTGPERTIAKRTLEAALTRFRMDSKAAESLVTVGDSAPRAKNRVELAAWTIVASQLLNLDETLTL